MRLLAALPLPWAVLAIAACGAAPNPARSAEAAAAAGDGATPRLAASSPSAPQRRVGDFFVHRFSGSFAAEPLTLTEEVKAKEGATWVVDFSLTQGAQVERLRVRFDEGGRAMSAARLTGSREAEASLADYEALVARTVYAADVNDGLISSTTQTCLVGADALDCETKTYKVWVGERAATLSVVHSSAHPDRDVAGELTQDDGKLLYRAELVEARQGAPSAGIAKR